MIIKCTILLTILTDSDSLFKTFVKSSTTSEHRLMIKFRAACEAFHRDEITTIGWVRSENNIADGLADVGLCEALENALCDDKMKPEIKQCIKRAKPASNYNEMISSCERNSYQKRPRCENINGGTTGNSSGHLFD